MRRRDIGMCRASFSSGTHRRPCNPNSLVTRRWFLALIGEHPIPIRTVGARLFQTRPSFAGRLQFLKIQNASMMPDRVPLFGLRLADKQQLVSFLRDRGLEIG